MRAVVLTGHGGLDQLDYREDVPVPRTGPGEVLVRVGACGMNNTDINTRTAWYSDTVTSGVTVDGGLHGFDSDSESPGSWAQEGIRFPLIQGADVAGKIVAVGEGVPKKRVGGRVLVDPWLLDAENPDDIAKATYLGSERNGGYAEYAVVPALNAVEIETTLSDAELATFPCSYTTAENLLTKTRLCEGETVLVTGASGGVGSAVVQLARCRGACIVAVAGRQKVELVRALGADTVIPRDVENLVAAVRDQTPGGAVDVVIDVVGGEMFPQLLRLLKSEGRYASSGAIAGPIAQIDLRVLIYNDLELHGATVVPKGIFERVIRYIQSGEVRPLLAKTFPLKQVREAQAEFLKKKHIGNFVLLPR